MKKISLFVGTVGLFSMFSAGLAPVATEAARVVPVAQQGSKDLGREKFDMLMYLMDLNEQRITSLSQHKVLKNQTLAAKSFADLDAVQAKIDAIFDEREAQNTLTEEKLHMLRVTLKELNLSLDEYNALTSEILAAKTMAELDAIKASLK